MDDVNVVVGRGLSCVFEGKQPVVAVDGVDFDIAEGRITGIVGESGSGKTTLLKLIYGLLAPSTGEIRYRNQSVPTRRDKLIPGHDAMKLVPQNFDGLNLFAKVWDNVASQLSNADIARKQAKTRAVLAKLRIAHLAEQRAADLSGGEKQRLAIARALVNEPEVLLMDEPFNQVDAAFREDLQRDIRTIVAESGLTVVLVSHDLSDVLAMADEIIVMKNAKIVEQGSPERLYHAPQQAYTARLLAKSNILEPEQAAALGIATDRAIAIHREDIHCSADPNGRFRIADILFQGFYSDLILTDGNLVLHAIQIPPADLRKGDTVDLKIWRFGKIPLAPKGGTMSESYRFPVRAL